jgi:hypothetical protein
VNILLKYMTRASLKCSSFLRLLKVFLETRLDIILHEHLVVSGKAGICDVLLDFERFVTYFSIA